ncbi:hypothetical protein CNMCM5793_007389 [Aspergillus hiratsukae]|uniref:Phosphotransferase n=1 Tax=Aspergillus hiratsukae TaxID=1194566 RepID=A0A8H6PHR0_9EURO|nr:hypothetical protein CNMCM5793_007389 [Aspergillus hiratsukae]
MTTTASVVVTDPPTPNLARKVTGDQLQDEFTRLRELFTVGPTKLKQITDHFVHELEVGLSGQGGDIPMNPTWVMELPHGDEKGTFFTMDMGGTNFRVCKVTLNGTAGKYDVVQMDNKIPNSLKSGTAEQLWHYIADCLQQFVDRYSISEKELAETPLAFTFSYPVTQTSISNGILQRWTKGFDIKGVEGTDVVVELQKVLKERGLPAKIVALVNDTVGTLMASSYVDSKTEIGSIFGTGSNAAYMERCSKIPKLADHHLPNDAFMAINCEYGAFDNSQGILPFTDYDAEIDRASPRPGQQRYEKMVAGFYLGEIFRLILLDLHNRKAIFDGQDTTKLSEPYVLDCSFLATIESDDSADLRAAKDLFEKTLSITPSPSELRFCYDLAHTISLRSARLYATGIAAIMKKRGLESCHVAVDGSVFNKYPCFPERAIGALKEILEWPADTPDPIQLIPAVDGSSVGAAVIASLISRSQS